MTDDLKAFKNQHAQHLSGSCNVEALWEFNFKQPIEKVWKLVSDSSRFNRAIGLGKRQESEVDGKLYVRDSVLGFEQEWIEPSWTWTENRMLAARRDYLRGACHYALVCITLEETSLGTKVKIYYGFQTRSLIWRVLMKLGLKRLHGRIGKLFSNFESSSGEIARVYNRAYNCDKVILERVRSIGKGLIKEGSNADCVDRLTDHICFGDELQLQRIRIKQLAEDWRLDWFELLRTALFACKHELLTMSWDSICPHCRGKRTESYQLSDVSAHAKCDACKLDFPIYDEDSLEITFHIHPAIRDIDPSAYCVAEPAKKPHILLQTSVESATQLKVPLSLDDGTYRLRMIGESQEFLIEVHENMRQTEVKINLEHNPTHTTAGNDFNLVALNPFPKAAMIVLEDLAPDRFCVRPKDIFGHPEFRKLFPREYLASGLKLNLGVQVILFTDIVGSTKFYEQMGDAFAFAKVREHFSELEEIIRLSRGVWVKTIGDSVMSSFPTTEAAMKAALRIQAKFARDRDDSPIRLRIVIHKGPVIAVNFNSGIDYFGATVNLAAKMQAAVGACEIGLSTACRNDLSKVSETFAERKETCRVGSQVVDLIVLAPAEKTKVEIAS